VRKNGLWLDAPAKSDSLSDHYVSVEARFDATRRAHEHVERHARQRDAIGALGHSAEVAIAGLVFQESAARRLDPHRAEQTPVSEVSDERAA
jgi:hypothetical protein